MKVIAMDGAISRQPAEYLERQAQNILENAIHEIKSSLEDSGEFELTANERHVASRASKDGHRRYRILYVPYVFSPDKWCVLELPNPMGEKTRNKFKTIGGGSVRLRFERQ